MTENKQHISEAEIDRVLDAVIDLPAARRMEKAMAMCKGNAVLKTRIQQILDVDASEDFLPDARSTDADVEQNSNPSAAHAAGSKLIGAWEVVRCIGRGGMGEVLEVRRADGQYQMRAALKRLHEQSGDHADRLERERQILAALRHPNIAQLIDGGIDVEGRPWMVM